MKPISSQRAPQRVILSRADGEGSRVRSLGRLWVGGDQRSLCEILRFAQDDGFRTGGNA